MLLYAEFPTNSDMQIEFVKDKVTKEPFDPDVRLSFQVQEMGLQPEYAICLYAGAGSVDGVRGDHVLLAPPYIVSKEEIDIIVDTTAKILTDVFADLKM